MNTDDVTLPELSGERIDEIEGALFASIGRDREHDRRRAEKDARARRTTRTRRWVAGGAAASILAVAVVLGPQMPVLLGGVSAGSTASEESAPQEGGDLGAPDTGGALEGESGSSTAPTDGDEGAATDREIIATASATIRVDDVAAAAEQIGEAAEDAGGYVEAMSVGGTNDTAVYGGGAEGGMDDAMIAPVMSGAWVTVRVPADELPALIRSLGQWGEVTSSQIDRRDVTSETIDLRARVTALEASVERLTALLGESASTADLIAAESALAQRQSELESYQQQLTYLENQVGMSTLTVSLVSPEPVVKADPAGFGDGIAAGWSGLVATLNGIVVALGFLLPWIAVLAFAGAIVWGVRSALRRRTAVGGSPRSDTTEVDEGVDVDATTKMTTTTATDAHSREP